MKRYIRSSVFTDNVKTITGIYYYDDIEDAVSQAIIASEDTSEEDQDISDINDLNSTDEYLQTLSVEHIQRIQNLELIGRIGRISNAMYNKLTQNQRMKFVEWSKITSRMSLDDIQAFLVMLKQCKEVKYAFYYRKNEKFAQLYGLTTADILEVLHSLEMSDYQSNSPSYDNRTWNDDYIVFHKTNVKLSSGKDLGNISIYIKLDASLSDKSTVVYASFHED